MLSIEDLLSLDTYCIRYDVINCRRALPAEQQASGATPPIGQ